MLFTEVSFGQSTCLHFDEQHACIDNHVYHACGMLLVDKQDVWQPHVESSLHGGDSRSVCPRGCEVERSMGEVVVLG